MSDNAFSKHEASRVLNNRERYDPLLDSVVDWNDKRHLKRYQFANELISKSDTVLDIACGTGYGLDLISHNCLKGFGVDISEVAIDFAKAHHQKPNLKYQIGDFFRFKKQTDVVISFETIEHMKAPALNVILDSLAKRAQRLLIGSIPYKEKPGNPHHMFFHLEEKDLNTLNDKGLLSFYYQNKDGKVDSQINGDKVVKNLIFTLEKK